MPYDGHLGPIRVERPAADLHGRGRHVPIHGPETLRQHVLCAYRLRSDQGHEDARHGALDEATPAPAGEGAHARCPGVQELHDRGDSDEQGHRRGRGGRGGGADGDDGDFGEHQPLVLRRRAAAGSGQDGQPGHGDHRGADPRPCGDALFRGHRAGRRGAAGLQEAAGWLGARGDPSHGRGVSAQRCSEHRGQVERRQGPGNGRLGAALRAGWYFR
mmetsp:Transcript_19997/g.59843  ORF Transcript_19997/g.59843 Transcript_19997/m.59843 type:complete len:216 (-) Transcript_19997:1915-2562(-)